MPIPPVIQLTGGAGHGFPPALAIGNLEGEPRDRRNGRGALPGLSRHDANRVDGLRRVPSKLDVVGHRVRVAYPAEGVVFGITTAVVDVTDGVLLEIVVA